MENEQTKQVPQIPTSNDGNVRIVETHGPDMIRQGSILPTFVAPPPPPPSNSETK